MMSETNLAVNWESVEVNPYLREKNMLLYERSDVYG